MSNSRNEIFQSAPDVLKETAQSFPVGLLGASSPTIGSGSVSKSSEMSAKFRFIKLSSRAIDEPFGPWRISLFA